MATAKPTTNAKITFSDWTPWKWVRATDRALTLDELAERAVQRRDFRRIVAKITGQPVDTRATHAQRGTAASKHFDRRPDRLRARAAFLRGALNNLKGLHANGKKMPAHYLHASSASNQEAPLAMAA